MNKQFLSKLGRCIFILVLLICTWWLSARLGMKAHGSCSSGRSIQAAPSSFNLSPEELQGNTKGIVCGRQALWMCLAVQVLAVTRTCGRGQPLVRAWFAQIPLTVSANSNQNGVSSCWTLPPDLLWAGKESLMKYMTPAILPVNQLFL